MTTLRKIGLDPGFDSNVVAEVQGSEIFTNALPSSVGLANQARKDGLTVGGVIQASPSAKYPFLVAFDGMEYLVGPDVGDFTQPIDRMDFDRFTDSPELRATVYVALYQIVQAGSHNIALAIALPVEVLQDKFEAMRVERAIRAWLVGQHVFQVNGKETALNIATVRAKIPQPVATWFDWGMDTSGQWIRGNEAMRAPTLIIDEGFNTLDVLVIEGGKISHRHTGGDTLGMRRAAERLMETLHNQYDLALELHQANEAIRQVVSGKKVETYLHGQRLEITQKARQAVGALEADVVNFLDRAVGKARAYQVLLTGGGALALSSRLLRLFPHAVVMYEPVLANARGLAKLAVRPGFLD